MTATPSTTNWFCVTASGSHSVQCKSEASARKLAKANDEFWPPDAPHRAVQLVEAAELETERNARRAAQIENESLKASLARADAEKCAAVLAEREACAALAESFPANRDWVPGSLWANIRADMAVSIRNRGNT